jgi:hypothetical protein
VVKIVQDVTSTLLGKNATSVAVTVVVRIARTSALLHAVTATALKVWQEQENAPVMPTGAEQFVATATQLISVPIAQALPYANMAPQIVESREMSTARVAAIRTGSGKTAL